MITIYEDEDLRNYFCRLASKEPTKDRAKGNRVLVRFYTTEVSPGVVLQTTSALSSLNQTVSSDLSIFAPFWVLRHLKVLPGDEVKYEQLPWNADSVCRIGSHSSRLPDEIRLIFREHINYRHWDEYSPADLGHSMPGEWDSKWPSGLTSDGVSAMIPSLLANTPLYHKAVVALDVLQTTIMFEVEIAGVRDLSIVWLIGSDYLRSSVTKINDRGDESESFVMKNKALFVVDITKTHTEESGTPPSLDAYATISTACTGASAVPLTPSGQRLLHKLMVLVTCAVSPADEHWGGPRSVVVSGPPGSGKSSLARALSSSLSGCTLLTLNTRDLLSYLSSSAGQRSAEALAHTEPGRHGPLGALLDRFAALCGPCLSSSSANITTISSSNSSSSSSGEGDTVYTPAHGSPRRVVLIIDDAHLLQLAPLVASSREDELPVRAALWAELQVLSRTGSGVLPLARAAHCLSSLLGALSVLGRVQMRGASSHPHEFGDSLGGEERVSIAVVGLSSLPPHLQPQAHQGCPVFETVVSLPRGGEEDRTVVLGHALQREHCDVGAGGSGAIARIAALLSGYSPADIVAVARQAKALALAPSLSPSAAIHANEEEDERQHSDTGALHVPWSALIRAASQVTPATLSQTLDGDGDGGSGGAQGHWDGGEAPSSLAWASFVGYEEAKSLVLTRLLRRPEAEAEAEAEAEGGGEGGSSGSLRAWARGGATPGAGAAGAVLYGPSGCGKTHLGRVVCSEARALGYNHLLSSGTALLSPYFGGSEERVRNMFANARAASPCVLFIDDFDVLAMRRSGGAGASGGGTESDVAARVLSTFLNELDGLQNVSSVGADSDEEASHRVVVVVAVAHLSSLDEALVRPGRLHLHIHLDYPTLPQAAAVMSARLADTPLSKGARAGEGEGEGWIMEVCRELLERRIGAGSSKWRLASVTDVLQLCDMGVRAAIREQVALVEQSRKGSGGSIAFDGAVLTKEHLLQSLPPAQVPEQRAKKREQDEVEIKPFVF